MRSTPAGTRSLSSMTVALTTCRTRWADLRRLAPAQVHPSFAQPGKGAAVRTGVQAAHGDRILFADADGATPIEEERKLSVALADGADLAIGSRLTADSQVVAAELGVRAVLGQAFAALARRMFALSVRDTQCGFKMFRRRPAERLIAAVPGERVPVRYRDPGTRRAVGLPRQRGIDPLGGSARQPAACLQKCSRQNSRRAAASAAPPQEAAFGL